MEKKFRLKHSVGCGSFGDVYEGLCVGPRAEESVAIKISSDAKMIEREAYIYHIIEGYEGFTTFKDCGTYNGKSAIALELFGKSLDKLLAENGGKFSLKTVLMLADQMLSRLEVLHRYNIIHCDIKPSNFSMGLGPKSNQVILYDFGLSEMSQQNSKTIHPFAGNAKYSSISSQSGLTPSKMDDLESLAYVFIDLLKGSLPWNEIDNNNFEKILSIKMNTPINELCKGLPQEFETFLDSVRSLDPEENPPYSYYRSLFRSLFIEKGYIYDHKYDWCECKKSTFSFGKQGKKKQPTLTPRFSQGSIKPNIQLIKQNMKQGLNNNLAMMKSISTINTV